GDGTDHAADLLAILEEDQRGDTHDAVTTRYVGAIVHVHLDGAQAALILAGQLLDDRSDLAARAAPGRPEVYQHRFVRLQHGHLETPVIRAQYTCAHRCDLLPGCLLRRLAHASPS